MCEGGSHLHNPAVGANRQVRPTTHPFHRRDDVDRLGRVAQVAQLRHLRRARAPQVHAAAEPNAQHVLRRPVYEVEVEIVLQLRRVENFERDAGYPAWRLAR
jgi:hypothetical protein